MTAVPDRLSAALAGRYRIERELGGGGMSRVFVAEELGLGRTVVLKAIGPEFLEGVSAERFAREIQLAARLQQANIVPLLAAGEAAGLPWFTMPYVRGESLRHRLASGAPLPLGQALDILRDVARALAYAHGEGVVHRDIKPENVLLSGATAMVADFGIAKALSASRTAGEAGAGTLTQAGGAIGTPAYMAPEQALGESVDHRADLYAWGVLAYELLSGAHPYAGRVTAQQLVAAHLAEPPPDLASACPDLPAGVAALVMQCLAKDPARRPDSAEALLDRLAMILTPSGERVASVPVQPVPAGWGRRGIAALGLIAVVVAAYLVTRRPDRESAPRSVVVVPFDNLGAPEDAYFADGVTDEIASQLARIPGLQVVARASAERFRGSGRSPREIATELGAGYALSGTVRWARASRDSLGDQAEVRIVPSLVLASTGVQVWGEPFQERLSDVFQVQANVAERVAAALSLTLGAAGGPTPGRARTSVPAAHDAFLLGRHLLKQRGLENLRQALSQFERAIAIDSSHAGAWSGLAEVFGLLPSYFDTSVTPEVAYARSAQAAGRAVQLDSLLPEAQVALGRSQVQDYRFNDALRSTSRALALDPSSAQALGVRFEALMSLGRLAEADTVSRAALRLEPFVPFLHAQRAYWHLAAGALDSARSEADRAAALAPGDSYWQAIRIVVLMERREHEAAYQACVAFVVSPALCLALRAPPGADSITAARRFLDPLGAYPGIFPLYPPMFQARDYAHWGLADSAFSRMRLAVARRDPSFFSTINLPAFRAITSDPRWEEIVGGVRRR